MFIQVYIMKFLLSDDSCSLLSTMKTGLLARYGGTNVDSGVNVQSLEVDVYILRSGISLVEASGIFSRSLWTDM